jgi:catechol 2,3-dioxygenase-like lactoylglutathione lyase family enzyme
MSVRDLPKSIEFYVDGMGFIERVSWGKPQKCTVLLDTGDGNYFEISQGDNVQDFKEGGFKHIALRVDDCKAAIELARKTGAEVTMDTRDVNLSSEPSIPIRIAFFK